MNAIEKARLIQTKAPPCEHRGHCLTDPCIYRLAVDVSNALVSQANKLAAIQQTVRGIREDYRHIDDHIGLDARLNKIEAMLGDCVSRARGEG